MVGSRTDNEMMCKEMEKKQVPRHRMLNKKKDDGYESNLKKISSDALLPFT